MEQVALARRAREHAAALARRPTPPGPLRLLSAHAHLGRWIGFEAVAALAALAVALALRRWRGLDRTGRGGLLTLGVWLVAGIALCSAMPGLRPRYLACLDPAVAACLGAGVALAVRGRPRRAQVAGAALLCAVLAFPLATALAAVRHGAQASGRTGAMPAARVAALSDFLRAHTAGTADEVAVSAPAKAGPLIARDGRPVLILSDGQGNQLVSPAALANAVATGRVRYVMLGDSCTAASGNQRTGCLPVVAWARAHGADVSAAAGQPHRGALYALSPAPAAAAGGCGRTARSARSRRTVPVAARSAGRRASRAPGRRGARARRASRRCSARQAISVTPGAGFSRSALPWQPSMRRHCHSHRFTAAVEVGRLAAVGDDLVGGAVDLEHGQRALRACTAAASGSRRRPTAAPARRSDRSQPSRAVMPPPFDTPVTKTRARSTQPARLELVERALERLDVVGAGGLAGEVPERVRSARRRIGDEEALAVGQPAEARVVGEVAAGLARAVQGDDQRPRLVGPARGVQEDLALAFGRVDASACGRPASARGRARGWAAVRRGPPSLPAAGRRTQ